MRRTAGERFWSKVDRGGECWLWLGYGLASGYGMFWDGERKIGAHVYSFKLHGGVLTPRRPYVLHSCDNPPCVNPAHLRAGSQKENIADAVGRKRMTGNYHPRTERAKLSEADVRDIRESPERGSDLAERYSVTRITIYNIRNYKTWKHLP